MTKTIRSDNGTNFFMTNFDVDKGIVLTKYPTTLFLRRLKYIHQYFLKLSPTDSFKSVQDLLIQSIPIQYNQPYLMEYY